MEIKTLLLGSSGLVGSSLKETLSHNKNLKIQSPSRNELDLFDYKSTKKYIDNQNPDLIINAAAKVGGINANNTQRVDFLLENLKININVLESSINKPNLKIINLGSSCIYPLGAAVPIKEDSFMTGVLEPTNSPYALAKITAIELGKSLKYQYGSVVVNLMPTNLYGYRDNFSLENGHVIPSLIHKFYNAKINNQESIEIWGSGSPLREFLHVDDFSAAVNFIIENNIEKELINVGSSEEITIKDLAYLIKDISSFPGEVIFDESMPDGNPRKLLDSSYLNSKGWKAKIKIRDGISKTFKWFSENYDVARK